MKLSSDAPPSQTTPTAQVGPAATPTNAKALLLKPKSKGKVSEIARCCLTFIVLRERN